MDLQLRKKSFLPSAGGEGLARHLSPSLFCSQQDTQKDIKCDKHMHNLVLPSWGKTALFLSHMMS